MQGILLGIGFGLLLEISFKSLSKIVFTRYNYAKMITFGLLIIIMGGLMVFLSSIFHANREVLIDEGVEDSVFFIFLLLAFYPCIYFLNYSPRIQLNRKRPKNIILNIFFPIGFILGLVLILIPVILDFL